MNVDSSIRTPIRCLVCKCTDEVYGQEFIMTTPMISLPADTTPETVFALGKTYTRVIRRATICFNCAVDIFMRFKNTLMPYLKQLRQHKQMYIMDQETFIHLFKEMLEYRKFILSMLENDVNLTHDERLTGSIYIKNNAKMIDKFVQEYYHLVM